MKSINKGIIEESIEIAANKHLDISHIHESSDLREYTLTGKQLHRALNEAFKFGEKYGYNHGFKNGKMFKFSVDGVVDLV